MLKVIKEYLKNIFIKKEEPKIIVNNIEEQLKAIENARLSEIEKTLVYLTMALNIIIKNQADNQEYLVSTNTLLEEMINLFENHTIILKDNNGAETSLKDKVFSNTLKNKKEMN